MAKTAVTKEFKNDFKKDELISTTRLNLQFKKKITFHEF
jgi:hypothetical protein